MLEDGLVTLLGNDSGVTALVGTRIYPTQGPPDSPTYPYLTYHAIPVAGSGYTLDGAESRHKTLQFEIWDTTFGGGRAVLKALRDLLSGYAGTLDEGTRVLFAARCNEMDNFDVGQRVFRSVCDYEFEFVES